MQVVSKTRRLSRVFKSPILIFSERFITPDAPLVEAPHTCLQWRKLSTFSSQRAFLSGITRGCLLPMEQHSVYKMMPFRAPFSSEASTIEDNPTEAVKELYDKILESVNVKRSMPPNALLWSLIENCKNQDDVKLLFDILQNLRRFRLSNLRIHLNLIAISAERLLRHVHVWGPSSLERRPCWKHNVYGLSPSIGSAHHLLTYAKEHNDVKLLMDQILFSAFVTMLITGS
ncbi:hypothetical protein M0R45_020877 [Rubus argutus]|uniref:Pentatricopeptide repeat-containing protein n=1 Tax=Rubus argutus TaxID=59490 RepID=A0AAW1XAV1_RUBAR